MNLESKRIVVVGGSRGLGLGLAEAFAERAAAVTVVARNTIAREQISEKLGLTTISADATSADAAKRIMEDQRPDMMVVNGGAEPPSERIDEINRAAFTANWNVNVKASLHWVRTALTMPMGQVVLPSFYPAPRLPKGRLLREVTPGPSASSGSLRNMRRAYPGNSAAAAHRAEHDARVGIAH